MSWIACHGCTGCPTLSKFYGVQLNFYDPSKSYTSSLIGCSDPKCSTLQTGNRTPATSNSSSRTYLIQYVQNSTTQGYYVEDIMHIDMVLVNKIIFGCSMLQSGALTYPEDIFDGVFGLGINGTILSQLSSNGVVPMMFTLCLDGSEDDFILLYLGEIEESDIVYTPIVPSQMSAGCSTQSTEANVHPPPPNKKYSIIVDVDGAKGQDATKWSFRCGVLICRHVPISYEDWRKVDDFYIDNLWKALMEEFEMNIDPKKARPILEKKFPRYFRIVKSTLRKKYLKKDDEFLPRRFAIDNRPDDVDKVQWETFVDNEYSEKKMKQCKTNAENKGKNTITHTLGRKSYTKLYDELEMENPECKPTRATTWKMAHKNRKTREVLPCAAEKYAAEASARSLSLFF